MLCDMLFRPFHKLIFCFFLLTGCASTQEELRQKGTDQMRTLIRELRRVETVDDLRQAEPTLRKIYLQIAKLMITAKKYEAFHPEMELSDLPQINIELSKRLQKELERVAMLEGGREVFESWQAEPLALLLESGENF